MKHLYISSLFVFMGISVLQAMDKVVPIAHEATNVLQILCSDKTPDQLLRKYSSTQIMNILTENIIETIPGYKQIMQADNIDDLDVEFFDLQKFVAFLGQSLNTFAYTFKKQRGVVTEEEFKKLTAYKGSYEEFVKQADWVETQIAELKNEMDSKALSTVKDVIGYSEKVKNIITAALPITIAILGAIGITGGLVTASIGSAGIVPLVLAGIGIGLTVAGVVTVAIEKKRAKDQKEKLGAVGESIGQFKIMAHDLFRKLNELILKSSPNEADSSEETPRYLNQFDKVLEKIASGENNYIKD